MAKSDDRMPKIPMDEKYLDLIVERMKEAKFDPAQMGVKSGRTAKHRMSKKKQEQLGVGLVNFISRELSKLGFPTPPPMVAVIDDDDYKWIELGRLVREASPSFFAAMLSLLQANLHEKSKALALKHEAVDSALKLVDERTKKSAKVTTRRGENE